MKSNKKVILKDETGLEIKSKSIDMTSIRQSAGQLPKLIKKDNLLESNQEEFITKNEIKKAFYPIIEQSGPFKITEEIGDNMKYLYISKKILKIKMRRNQNQIEQIYDFDSGQLLRNNTFVKDKKTLSSFFALASKLFNSVERDSVHISEVK
tara:strand:- start:481 stop:936 length:456 start_codon:yes stop_codon:yes gene_type:complete